MKSKNFREMRREEKRKQFERKQRAEEEHRMKRRAEKQAEEAKRREQEQQAPDRFVGRMELTNRGGVVYVNSKWLKESVVIEADKLLGAQEGDKVVIRLLRKGNRRALPTGEVVEVLGLEGENDTEMHAILAEYGLPHSYPADVEAVAEKIGAGITAEEVRKRLDMRDVLTFTIDPRDAKDFDDALSFRVMGENDYEVGVHIADVTHYVRPGDVVDKEGYARATSVYLVDRTIPMLPEHLSNGICSLRPNEDKLTFSVIFRINQEGTVLDSAIRRTVICSDYRLCYEEAQAVLMKPEEEVAKQGKQGELEQALRVLDGIAKQLREKRMAHGAIDFDREEPAFEIDEAGKPLRIYFKRSEDANKLIEEFMLLANRTVAAYVGKFLRKPFVYRVHDVPDPEKLRNVSEYIRRFGYNLKMATRKETISKNINHLMGAIHGKPEQDMIQMITLRAMAKAVYSTENIGHYGLAFPYYTHFTSPIRRYPDMMVHRLLERYMKGGTPVSEDEYEEYCKHCSAREQLAANAERASIKYKQVEFMKDKLGQTFSGIVSGVTEWGLYVELDDTKCEGLIPIRDILPRDYYECLDKEYCLQGQRTGKTYTLGDRVQVTVERADLNAKQLDFAMVDDDDALL